MNETKAELLKIVQEMMDTLEPLLEESQESRYPIKMDGMWFSKDYMENTRDLLKSILSGQDVDYEEFYMSISLEMISNSRKWNSLRYWLRAMSWDD